MDAFGAGLTRRRALLGGAALAGAALWGGYYAWTWRRPAAEVVLTPPEAHRQALAGDILLIDIRRPDEWAETGVPEGAVPLDMRRPDFTAALQHLRGGAAARPVALICARGVRSSQLTARLVAAGITDLIDVPEGMLGAPAGPGWLARGLPTLAPEAVLERAQETPA